MVIFKWTLLNFNFKWCKNIVTEIIQNTLLAGFNANCYLEKVRFQQYSRLKIIEYKAFQRCFNLKQIIIPKTVEIIEYDVFNQFVNLSTLIYCGNSAFSL